MQLIDNQPISFRETLETDSPCNLGDKKTYCQLFEQGDRLKAQWIIDPCSTVECEDEVGDNLVSDNCLDWIDDGHGVWTCLAGVLSADGSGGGFFINQTINSVAGHTYLVSFTISNRTVGSVGIKLGSGASYTYYTSNGTYTVLLTDTSDHILKFITGGTNPNFFDGDISDIFVYGTGCYSINNTSFSIDTEQNAICHLSGIATTLTVDITLELKYYGISIVVSGQTQGSVRIVAGTQVGEWFDSNGIKTSFLTADGTSLTIEMDSDFDGCVSFLKADLYPALEDWEIGLFDLNGNWIEAINTYGLTEFLNYVNNFVTLDWYISSGGLYYTTTPEGCYKICLSDPCQEHSGFVYGSDIFQDDFDDNSQWTLGSGITISGGNMIFATTGGGGTKEALATGFLCNDFNGCEITIRINFSNIAAQYIGSHIGVNIGNVSHAITIDADLISDGFAEFTETVSLCNGFALEFDNSVAMGGGVPTIEIDSLFVKVSQECFFDKVIPDYCSNCISIKEEQPCTVRFEAYCDEPALGFNFTNFSLIGRLRTLFINPFSKNKNENYKYSNGAYFKSFAERDKVWEVLFDYVDEITHDTINLALICDHLKLYNPVTFPNNDEHIWVDDSYKPEWDKEGRQKLAQSRIELRKKEGNLTNSNCG